VRVSTGRLLIAAATNSALLFEVFVNRALLQLRLPIHRQKQHTQPMCANISAQSSATLSIACLSNSTLHTLSLHACSPTTACCCYYCCRKPFSDEDTDEDNDDDDYVDDMDITKKSVQNTDSKGVGRRVSVCAEPLDPNAVSSTLLLSLLHHYCLSYFFEQHH
jgi:hypothetical protein